jgi:Ca-activated chloride channel family protein
VNEWLRSTAGVELLHPWLLLLMLPAFALLLFHRRAPALPLAVLPVLEGDAPGKSLPTTLRQRLVPLAPILIAGGLLLAVVALARPVEKVPIPLRGQGVDILLCLDVSSSMEEEDLQRGRTRLEVAREAATEFLRGRPGDRVGLVAFARFPDLVCPPTQDHDALRALLHAVEPVKADGPEDATGIGTAVARAAQVLHGGPGRSKVVILLTDGTETVAVEGASSEIAPLHAAQLCERLGVRVHVVVAGAEAGAGTADVRTLAERTGGRFFAARDAGTLAGVYADIDTLERSSIERPRFELVEKYAPFLLCALGLLLAGRFLGTTVLAVDP